MLATTAPNTLKKHTPAIALVLAFATPFLLAVVVLKLQLFNAAVNNNGQLFAEDIYLSHLEPQSANSVDALNYWNFGYRTTDKNAPYIQALLTQSHPALGKHQSHVNIIPLSLPLPVSPKLPPHHIYLIDHKGLLVMGYTLSLDEAADREIIRGLLKDTKKLLKYRRSTQ